MKTRSFFNRQCQSRIPRRAAVGLVLLVAVSLTLAAIATAAVAQDKLPTDAGMYYQSGTNYSPLKKACNSQLQTIQQRRGVSLKFIYQNPSAPTQLTDHHPTFVLVGPDDVAPVRTQFALVQMNVKKKSREAESAVGGVLKNAVDVEVTREASYFKVTPTAHLASGEYLIGMYRGVNDATSAGRMAALVMLPFNLVGCGYDFSVK